MTKYKKTGVLADVFDRINSGAELEKPDIESLLSLSGKNELNLLFEKAYEIKLKYVGKKVYLRGLIEFSNICDKNCFYCGIRKDNKKTKRFQMTLQEIVGAGIRAFENHYGSIVLQSGERNNPRFTEFVALAVKKIKEETGGKLGITLCLGEQSEETYQKWFDAGAHRYLLRIETSSENLYKKLHPAGHGFRKRHECLLLLKKIGYQVGTGVMIGLPGQTIANLADDILYFRKLDVDMLGMGPYIVHDDTPIASEIKGYDSKKQLELGLKMIAAARIVLKDVNIASTTALHTLSPDGRKLGLKAGANVIMPNITETKHHADYQLYKGKPCLDESASIYQEQLRKKIESIGETIAFDEWGDPPHFFRKNSKLAL